MKRIEAFAAFVVVGGVTTMMMPPPPTSSHQSGAGGGIIIVSAATILEYVRSLGTTSERKPSDKVYNSAAEAVADKPSDSTIIVGGFGTESWPAGRPLRL